MYCTVFVQPSISFKPTESEIQSNLTTVSSIAPNKSQISVFLDNLPFTIESINSRSKPTSEKVCAGPYKAEGFAMPSSIPSTSPLLLPCFCPFQLPLNSPDTLLSRSLCTGCSLCLNALPAGHLGDLPSLAPRHTHPPNNNWPAARNTQQGSHMLAG